jgi:hypothetical protein
MEKMPLPFDIYYYLYEDLVEDSSGKKKNNPSSARMNAP